MDKITREATSRITKLDDLLKDTKINRPHVVILGAGASLAAFPNGEQKRQKAAVNE